MYLFCFQALIKFPLDHQFIVVIINFVKFYCLIFKDYPHLLLINVIFIIDDYWRHFTVSLSFFSINCFSFQFM